MNNPYDLHFWSKDYRRRVLREARGDHSAAGAGRKPAGTGRARLTWENALAPLLGGERIAG